MPITGMLSKIKIERPLANAHVLLLPALIILFQWVFLIHPCNSPNKSPILGSILVTTTLALIFWSRHLSFYPIVKWTIFVKYLATSILDIVIFTLMVLIISIPLSMLPAECYTNRAKISEAILYGSDPRTQITENIYKNKTIQGSGIGVTITPNEKLLYNAVTSDGVIIIVSKDPSGVAVLTPIFSNGQVSFKCSGAPQKLMPAHCIEK